MSGEGRDNEMLGDDIQSMADQIPLPPGEGAIASDDQTPEHKEEAATEKHKTISNEQPIDQSNGRTGGEEGPAATQNSKSDSNGESAEQSIDCVKRGQDEEAIQKSDGDSNNEARTPSQSGDGDKIDLAKAPEHIQKLIDQISATNERLGKLESKILQLKKNKSGDDGEDSEESGSDDETSSHKTQSAEKASEEDSNEGYPAPKTKFRKTTAREDRSEFLSPFFDSDPRVCLWVLYTSTAETPSPPGTYPMPSTIEVTEIGIRSDAIFSFLSEEWDYTLEKDGIIHMRWPFRTLLRKTEQIHQHAKWLENLYGATPMDDAASTETAPTAALNPETAVDQSSATFDTQIPAHKSKKAVLDFQELVCFLDVYLKEATKLYNVYRGTAGSEIPREIAFENLWMIFDPDDLVYCHAQKPQGTVKVHVSDKEDSNAWVPRHVETPQAYRILASCGALRTTAVEKIVVSVVRSSSASGSSDTKKFEESQNKTISMHEKFTPFYLDCYFIDFDGTKFTVGLNGFEFKPYTGKKKITSLEVYPSRFRGESGQASQVGTDLTQRGKDFLALTLVSHRNFDGTSFGERKEEINGPVIVDYKLGFHYNPEWKPTIPWSLLVDHLKNSRGVRELPRRDCEHTAPCQVSYCAVNEWDEYKSQQNDYAEKTIRRVRETLDELQVPRSRDGQQFKDLQEAMDKFKYTELLPGYGNAYALRSRKWVQLDISQLSPATQDDGDWDSLVLPDGHKEMVQAVVQTHAAGSRSTAFRPTSKSHQFEPDLVRGKGKGCIILLHGEPGVGKTSTAECVAAFTGRPLYPITCGDIGTSPEDVEESLDKHFTLAHKWGCVLLLDEADVFLAKRDETNIERNGMVSVFLRLLEYYSGILFLTTNRVGTLDSAFRSRIHVSLYYPPLTCTQAVQIFKNNLERLKKLNEDRLDIQQPVIKFNAKQLIGYFSKKWDDFRWNGRQIRNAFQTAVALAEFEMRQKPDKSPRIIKSQFEQVAKVAKEFEGYLKAVHRASEADMAHRRSERVDVPSAEEVEEKKKKEEQKRQKKKQEMDKEKRRDKEREKKKTKKTKKQRKTEEQETSEDSDSSVSMIDGGTGITSREEKGKKSAVVEASESSDEQTSDSSGAEDTSGSESEASRSEKKTKQKSKARSKKDT